MEQGNPDGTLTPVENLTSLQFTSPGTKKVPPVQVMDTTRRFSGTLRHVPVPDVVEPKVFSPHAKTMGHAPRRIEVERKKRMYASVDLNDALKRNGVIDHLVKEKESGASDGMHLHLFDNTDFESRSNEDWQKMVNQADGLPGRAMLVKEIPPPNPDASFASLAADKHDKNNPIEWRHCKVVRSTVDSLFEVAFYSAKLSQLGVFQEDTSIPRTTLHRIFVCFDAEDPTVYCNRLFDCITRKSIVNQKLALNLYVDCMPVDNLKPLDSEQVNRILDNAINMNSLRNNPLLDTSSLLQQYNLNHMRTLNQLIFVKLLRINVSEVQMVKTASVDSSLFDQGCDIFPPRLAIDIPSDVYKLSTRLQEFKFNSLWNRLEAIRIVVQIQSENYGLEKQSFFSIPEKTLRLQEYVNNQQAAGLALGNFIKDSWFVNITSTVRQHLKDVKKGWFNIEESNLEVYNFSKLKKFLVRINFMMEDTLRNMMIKTLEEYYHAIKRFCPTSINVVSNDRVDVVGGRFPLLKVDLKFVNAAGDTPAAFIYSTTPQSLHDAIMAPFDSCFEYLKGLVKLERRVMKQLFWASNPIVRVPHAGEDWVVDLRNLLDMSVKDSLVAMEDYLATLSEFTDLISIDVAQYAADAAEKFCSGETMNLPELCELARKHADDAESVFNLLPSAVSLGFVMVDCNVVKTMLAAKHKNIAAKLFDALERKTKEYADALAIEFQDMYTKLEITPPDIEGLIELREYMVTLPPIIEGLAGKIEKNESHYLLMEEAKWRINTDQMDLKWEINRWPYKMQAELSRQEKALRVLEYNYKKIMEEDQQEFASEIQNLAMDVGRLKTLTNINDAAANAEIVRRLRQTITTNDERARLFNSREQLYNSATTEYNDLPVLAKELEPYYDLWDSAEKWFSNKEIWTNGTFVELDAEAVENSVNALVRNLAKSGKTFDRLKIETCSKIVEEVKQEVEDFKPKVPIITSLRNAGMRERHWEELCEKTGITLPEDKNELTLKQLVSVGMLDFIPEVEKCAEKAGKEFAIETCLDKMEAQWVPVMLVIDPYRETGTYILKGIDEYMALLDEQITMTQAMAFSAFKGPFEQRIDRWNSSLQVVSEVVDEWVTLQRNWLYLQPIFDSADINKQLPQEGKRFATVDKYWRTTMSSACKGVQAIKFCDDHRLNERFKEGNKLLEMVQKGLSDYLETKRAGFSRFYFLSNDELLEILSETKDPVRVQPHLRKCFEAIKSVEFQPDLSITQMNSPEGEKLQFVSPVDPKGKNIENWMGELKDAMVASVRDYVRRSILAYTETPRTEWMCAWPGQCVLNGSQSHWTAEVEESLVRAGNAGCFEYYEKLKKQLDDMVILIRGKISKLARTTVGALAVIDVHARDVQLKMANAGVAYVTDFDWISQMRYYWDGDIQEDKGNLSVIMVSSKRWYGYEYLGNSFRLVITPLTDKCYMTLMGALQMMLGGAPAGPAGTGKTETTKDLAKALAMQCVVFNCSDGLDYLAMGKFFKGLASSGAWACFDEFNRINIEVLSVIAQQIIQLQSTVQRGEKRTVFEGTDIVVNPDFSVFITMNPGYAGRAELPDNLEALFRPVAMMVPDYGLIGEIMLFSFGYMENRKCAQKMVATFRLCSEQLSAQDHYDYGMRAVKTVITAAGNLKSASPEANEEALLMRALQDVNVPKFLAHDLPLYAGILTDLFPGIERPPFDYGPLITCLKESIAARNLQPVQMFITKNIELYEMICVRHGLMVVGPTGGGKSCNIRVLGDALSLLKSKGIEGERYEKTKILHLNPKSIKMGQLYGEFDENTHEWRDGILCVLIRQCIKQDDSVLKWMLFDGPVDALWIENMNTVLDDNKKLCLTSGEIISLSEPMTMMFEPEDLAVASPATVSRCGMIYMEPTSLGYDVLFQSWLNTFPDSLNPTKSVLSHLFDVTVPAVLPFMRRNTTEPLPTTNNSLVQSVLNLMDTFINPFHPHDDANLDKTAEEIASFLRQVEGVYVFCLIWGMCATVSSDSRTVLDEFLRSEFFALGIKNIPPSEASVYSYNFNLEEGGWIHWTKSVAPYVYDPKHTFAELIIPTKDSICYTHLFDILVRNKKHLLMTGPTGTGKTVNIIRHMQSGLPDKYVPITMGFSAQTSANQTQDLIDSKCEKRRKGVYGPPVGKEFVIFVDDVNMPQKEIYGAQPPIEILRQWFDDHGWYDRKALEIKKIVDIIFVLACGPPGGGRNHVTARFYRHFNTINYADISAESLQLIFGTILRNFLAPFEEDVQKHTEGIVQATVDIYSVILDSLRPTPTKPHYVFNMRDISKVFQGLLMIDKRRVTTGIGLGRVWTHEITRVFGDRLICTEDQMWLKDTVKEKMEKFTDLRHEEMFAAKPDVIMSDFMIIGADVRVYEEVSNMSELQNIVEEYLGEYNAESKQPMDLVMFKDALLHVSKIARVLRQPSGNALLLGVGGSGRQSLTKLATFISGFKLYQIEIAKGYGMNEWRENLKECLLYAGVGNKPIVFLFNDVQIINESMLEDINGVLNSGDVPNIYGPEDLESIASACKADCAKKRIPPTKLNLFAQYLVRVTSNIHVCLCMSPLGDAFRGRLRKFPSICNCCTIDWFMEWPDEALQSVAARFMSSSNLKIDPDVESKLCMYFQYIHQSIEKASIEYKNSLKRFYYVTPTSYLQLLTTYARVLTLKRKEVGTLRDRLSVGVDKLVATEKAVNELQDQLKEMEPVLIKTQAEVEVMIVDIGVDKGKAAETKAIVEVEEAAASKKASETKAIADDAQRDLDEALPALEEAVQCLKSLKKADIDEVKSLGKPPAGVVKTLQVCCIMFDIKPDKINDPDNPGKKINDYFKPAGKHLLSNANKLMDDMLGYDKDNIAPHIITAMEPFYNDPQYTPEVIEKASKACKALCMWTRAMYKYHQVCLVVEPKKKLLAEATESLEITMAQLAVAQESLAASEARIAQLEASFKEANDKKEQLVIDVDQCRARLDRAVKLMSGLGGERTRWTETCARLNGAYNKLVGDCLVTAGSIGYLGVFTPDFRHNIVESWQKELVDKEIPHAEGCDLRSTLSDPVAIRAWTICGLPQDSHSVENGIVMSNGRRYPLLIDPQGQANRYIKNMGKDTTMCPNDLDVIKLTEKNFLRTLENGVRFGRWVLLENIGETLDASLEPLLLQQKFKQGGTEMIKIGDSTIPWNDQFKFFITTKLPNPHYPPEVCVKVSLVNFAITFTGLEDQLLGVVVVEEMPEMEEKKNSLMVSNARMRKELQDLEDQILYMLSNSTGNILDDHKLIETLGSSKIKSQEITLKVVEAEKTEKMIDESRNMYRPVAFRGSILYFCIADLGNVDPMYQYSLQWFRNLFVQAIRLSEASQDIDTRLENLNNFFTYYVYTNICRSLFERHKLLFSFLLTVRILQGSDKINMEEYMFLISGKATGGKTENLENPAPSWIDGRMWSEMTGLATLSAFDGLAHDVVDKQLFWREIYDSQEPQKATLPFGWSSKLSSFQKLCFLRTIRADVVATAVMEYVIEIMGQKFVDPPPFDLLQCYNDSNLLTPLVFVLSKGSDPAKGFLDFASKMKMDKKVRMLSLGQGQGTKAIKMVEEGTQKGGWVFLQNCHLFISWLSELERICENLSPDTVHKDFRLWLTSMPCADFPVAVLQSAVKMTNEPPKGLKANLRNAYYKLNNDLLNVTQKPDEYKKLLFGLSFFHAVVQERRIFGPLGWNIPYEFNDTDLDISKGQLEIVLDQYDETPWEVLNILTSYINYGGRVTDYIDLRTIDVIMKSFYNPNLFRPYYRFDNEGIFYSIEADPADPHASYMAYIDSLPLTAAPGVFGMHDNARIASANADTFLLCNILLSLQASDSGGSGGASKESQIETVAQGIVGKNIKAFDVEAIGMMYPVVYEQSMNTVLLQECIRYNKLINVIQDTLPQLILALKGLVVMSQELEAISNSLFLNVVPDAWTNVAYPSLKNLLAWCDDLVERLKFIQSWIDKGIPATFWISGFYFPQAFLTGSLQNFARKYQIAIDTVAYDFKFMEESWEQISLAPENGVYIRGLFLEGARWDPEIKSLNDSLPKKLYTDVPVIHLLPKQNRVEPTGGVYRCPVYKILSRRGTLSTTGHSTNFVMWIEFPSNRESFINNEGKADQEVWVKAGVASFTSLMY